MAKEPAEVLGEQLESARERSLELAAESGSLAVLLCCEGPASPSC